MSTKQIYWIELEHEDGYRLHEVIEVESSQEIDDYIEKHRAWGYNLSDLEFQGEE